MPINFLFRPYPHKTQRKTNSLSLKFTSSHLFMLEVSVRIDINVDTYTCNEARNRI